MLGSRVRRCRLAASIHGCTSTAGSEFSKIASSCRTRPTGKSDIELGFMRSPRMERQHALPQANSRTAFGAFMCRAMMLHNLLRLLRFLGQRVRGILYHGIHHQRLPYQNAP